MSHRSALLAQREQLAAALPAFDRRLRALRHLGLLSEWVVLSTCNRFEVWGAGPLAPERGPGLARAARGLVGRATDEVLAQVVVRCGDDAVRHLVRVASGLDSMILGEAQIAGQARRAFADAGAAGTAGALLGRLFPHALRWGRQARSRSGLGRFAVSVARTAVEVARRIFGSLEGVPVLVLGTGKMGRLTLAHLARCGAGPVTVVNRTLERAEELAARYGGRAASLEALPEALAGADVAVTAVGAGRPLVSREDLVRAAAARRGRPLFVVDLGLPRDVAADGADVPGVYLYNVDDLQGQVDQNLAERERAAAAAEAVVEESVAEFRAWLATRRLAPLLADLEARVESVVDEELGRLLAARPGADEAHRGRLRAALRRVGRRLLHPVLVRLRESVARRGEAASEVALELLGSLAVAEGEDDEHGEGC